MNTIDLPLPPAELLPKDPRALTLVNLVNSILANPDFYPQFKQKFEEMGEDEELTKFPELMQHVYDNAMNDDPEVQKITYINITFGPEATRESAIENLLDMFDPVRREAFEKSFVTPMEEFGDRHLPRKDFREVLKEVKEENENESESNER